MSHTSNLRLQQASRKGWMFIAPIAVLVTSVIAAPALGMAYAVAQDTNPSTNQTQKPAAPPATAPADQAKRDARDQRNPVAPAISNRARPQNGDLTPTRGTAPARAVTPGEPAAQNQQAAIKFDPAVLDFGEMTAGVAVTLKVKIVNIIDQPVTVTKAVASCGCTIPTWPKEPIPVGGSAEAEITLKPPEKQGLDLHKRVTFQLDGHSPVVLDLKGHVAEFIKISPEMMEGPGKDEKDGAKDGLITLTSVDGKPFKILGANPPLVKDISAEAKAEHQVHVDWATWAESGKSAKLAFTTDHPKAGNLTVIIKRTLGDQARPQPEQAVKPSQPMDPVIQAVRANDLQTLPLLLADGKDPNVADPVSGGRTALHWAVKEGRKEMIPLLLQAKANLEAKDRVGKTPLTLAAEGKDIEIVKLLVEKGADVNARDQIGGSPVLWASGLGSPDVVKYLIQHKADVNVIDVNGLSPLLWSASIGSPEAVTALLSAGAKVDVQDKMSGDTALMRAARTGKFESMKAILDAKADVNAKNNLGHTPFMFASMNGDVKKLEALKAAGADVAAKDARGWNALDYANNRIDAGKNPVVAYLKEFVPASGAIASPEAGATPKTTPTGDSPVKPAAPATPKAPDSK
ncbi:MAG: ankyrin repeat domain-containing protein [Phycisphaerae bacterium]|nr:ankyrin repeat domain-containing protein [Phycisphaerae bacterium]